LLLFRFGIDIDFKLGNQSVECFKNVAEAGTYDILVGLSVVCTFGHFYASRNIGALLILAYKWSASLSSSSDITVMCTFILETQRNIKDGNDLALPLTHVYIAVHRSELSHLG